MKSVAGVLAATVVGGIALRVTVRDGFAPLAPTFYALSAPVLTLLGLAAALAAAGALGLRLTVKGVLMLSALGLLAAANTAIFLYEDVTFDDRPRVVVWNVARGAAGWAKVADALEAHHPTLAVLVESGEDGRADAFWRERFGGQFFVERPGAGITVLSRGPTSGVELVQLPVPNCGDGFAVRTKTQLGGQRVAVLAVDLPSNPKVDRGPAMRHVLQLARELAAERPTLIAGDFNTPPDSVHFDALRQAGFVHAFERHGRGYAATWPVPAPVLHLDHLWLSPGFDVGEVSHGWTSRSDHRLVLAPTRVAPAEYAAFQSALRPSRTAPAAE
ncbi:endonuclease/exonuclease/phosphatase family protein [Alienimonas sp. DA493]|uniref:endonuclease/exonuclease/phosphatase family protein n=1 Tax=Alienimonas sp. DA493 TaxID=3373605 RepID=UPI003754FA1C